MPTIYFGSISKRKNSTYQPTLSSSYDCIIKQPSSIDNPVFIIQDASFNMAFNYAKWENTYYFVDSIITVRNDVWEVHCSIDVLATYKAEIIASTQYVSYSSLSGGTWLADTRIPLLKDATVSAASTTMNFLFTDAGFYVLTAVGKDGCHTYCCDISHLTSLIDDISTWTDTIANDFLSNLPTGNSSPEEAIENLYNVMAKCGAVGNAYTDAPSCIRSCIWVPFFASFFADGGGVTIYLGQYDTGVTAYKCKPTPETRTASVSIPWQYSDWRRAVCEEVYLYLPLVGLVAIPSDEIVKETAIDVTWSATATDGCIAYLVKAGNQVIGTYGANCSVNYPIGISQQASAGEIVQSIGAGINKTVSGGISGAKTGGIAGAIGGTLGALPGAAYDIINTASMSYNSCIGGIGGGAGTGLSLDLKCFTVAHPTVITPSDMKDTMGLPTMKPVSLSTLTGYCQCANAHVAAPAMAGELDMIDAYLNSGFYIE